MAFTFEKTKLAGVIIVQPQIFGDSRGYFLETYKKGQFAEVGIDREFVQDNESSSTKGVLRGLHFQKNHTQGKLVRVIKGEVLDIAVDIRVGSPTFGKWVGVRLSEQNASQLFIPRGFAHGFCVLSEEAVFQYKCDRFYDPAAEGAIAWNDPDLAVDWGIPAKDVLLSEKDKHHRRLRDIPAGELFEYGKDLYR